MTDYLGSIICLGGSQESLPIVQKILSMGYRPIILDRNPECAVNIWWAGNRKGYRSDYDYGLRDKLIFLKADCYNYDSCHQALVWAEKKEFFLYDNETFNLHDLRGVLCCAVDSPLVCARLADRYRLPNIGAEVARLGVNKFWQAERLSDAGITVPRTKVVNPEMTWDEIKDYDIVKPVDSRGARGVRFYDKSNWREAFVEALNYSPGKMIIAQKFIPGVQLSTESVVYDGEVQMTSVAQRNYDRLKEFAPYIVEDGCDSVPPSRLNRQINDLLERACRALGWNNCTVKGDLILDGNLLYVVELAPRLSGGFFSTHTICLSMGWDIVGDAVQLAVGGKPTLSFNSEVGSGRYVCQRYIFPKREWVGKLISKLPQFPSDVNFGTWNVKVGDTLQPVRNHPSRLGQVIVVGETYTDTVSKTTGAVKEILNGIEVE